MRNAVAEVVAADIEHCIKLCKKAFGTFAEAYDYKLFEEYKSQYPDGITVYVQPKGDDDFSLWDMEVEDDRLFVERRLEERRFQMALGAANNLICQGCWEEKELARGNLCNECWIKDNPEDAEEDKLEDMYEDYLNEIGVPDDDLYINGGRIPDFAKYGEWMRKNDIIAWNVGFQDWKREREDGLAVESRGICQSCCRVTEVAGGMCAHCWAEHHASNNL
jgi:hypothetical protein